MPKVCTFDVESNGLLPEADTIWCAVIKDHETGDLRSYSPDSHDDYIKAFTDDLDTYDVAIGHNCIAFDFPLLRNVAGYSYTGKKVDTLLMSRVQRPKRRVPPHCPAGVGPHSVQAWGYRLGRGKVEHEDWSQFTPEMLHRCEEDVEIQVLLYHTLLEEGRGENWAEAHKLNFRLFELLQRQEEYGWLVDRDHMLRGIRMLDHWMDRIDRALETKLPIIREVQEVKKDGEYNYVRKPFKKDGSLAAISLRFLSLFDRYSVSLIGGPFSRVSFHRLDLNSNLEVKNFLLDLGWEPDQWNTNSEGERTSPKLHKDDPFHGLDGPIGRLVARRFQCKSRKAILEGLIGLIREDGRIAARVTGLANTYRAKHAGIVNIPGDGSFFGNWMRRSFIAKPGWVLVCTDSDSNQARQLAARMGDDDFTHAVLYGKKEDGTSFHHVNAKKTNLPYKKAKNFFYAFIFGVGNEKLGRMLGNIGTSGAKGVRERYLTELLGLKALLDRGIAEWRKTAVKWFNPRYNRMEYKDGWVTALDGRPMQVESEHKILGYYLQSDEAIQLAAAYCVFHKWMNRAGYKYREDYGTVAWYHDEFTVECKPEIANRVGQMAAEAIAWSGRYYKIPVPHKGNYKIGNSWFEIH